MRQVAFISFLEFEPRLDAEKLLDGVHLYRQVTEPDGVTALKEQTERNASFVANYIGRHASDARSIGFEPNLPKILTKKGGVSAADAVYSKSPTLPAGPATFDAENHRGYLSGNWNTDGARTYG